MGIAPTELAVQRSLTESFIAADAKTVTLTGKQRVEDGAGGYLEQDVVRELQLMRLIPLGDGAEERLTADGKAVRPTYMLMGDHDASMERWDTFTLPSGRYQIVFVNENRQYETKGEAIYLGS